jgi:DNA-binding Lrp family transcriptional regulator
MQYLRMTYDEVDTQLLAALQEDAQMTALDLANRLNLSASQIGRRKHRLENAGIIRGYTARLDPAQLGLSVQGFIQVQMANHASEQAQAFARLVATSREITSCWTLTGEADYLLHVFCEDLQALNRLIQDRLLPHPAVARVQSQIVMDQLKSNAPLPT